MPDVKDQDRLDQSKRFDAKFEEGWSKVDAFKEEMEVASGKEKPKGEEKVETKKIFKHKKCKECPEEEEVPYRILKVGGEDVPVWSEEELIAKAQMGHDYTKKTQQVAEERKGLEKEYSDKAIKLEELAKKFDGYFEKGVKEGKIIIPDKYEKEKQEKAELEKTKDQLYEQYGIDKEFAEPYQIRFIEDIIAMRKENEELKGSIKDLKSFVDMSKIERGLNKLGAAVNAGVQKYPIEVPETDEGKKLIAQQITSIIDRKAKEAQREGKDRDLESLAEEAVKEIHETQKAIKESGAVKTKLTAAQIKEQYPDTYKEIIESAGKKAVILHEKEKSDLPPPLPKDKGDISLEKLKGERKEKSGKSLSDYLDEGFKDPEILKGLTGESGG